MSTWSRQDAEENLWLGIQSRNLDLVIKSLVHGADLNSLRNGKTPLAEAVSRNEIKIMECLIKNGADLTKYGLGGQPPLHIAVLNNSIESVKYLLSQKVNINTTCARGQTALTTAVEYQRNIIIDHLLKEGADVNRFDKDGRNPLSKACFDKPLEIVKKLINKGANVNICSGPGNSPIADAVCRNNTEIVKYILANNADINLFQIDKEESKPPLSWASSGCDLKMVKLLIEHGAKINQTDFYGSTALTEAIKSKKKDIAEYLLTQEADVCKIGTKENAKTPLYVAVESGVLDTVEWLLENGAHPTLPTAFLKAIELGNDAIVKCLHARGAKINLKYKNGDTPLKKSIEMGHSEICEYLINNGADVSVVDEKFKIEYLMKHLLKNNFPIIKLIIQMKVNLDLPLESGYTVLNKCVELESYSKVKFLVEHGAKINEIDENKKSALGIAAVSGAFSIAKFLIDSGADANLAAKELQEFAQYHEDMAIYLETIIQTQISGSGQEESN